MRRPLALLITASAVFGCDSSGADSVPRQVVLVVNTDARTDELVDELRVRIYDTNNKLVFDETNDADASRRIPLVPADGDPERLYRVVVDGIGVTGDTIVTAEAQGGYPDAKEERVVQLAEACHFLDCAPSTTCEPATRSCQPACDGDACVLSMSDVGVFVDPGAGSDSDTECTSPDTPCATVDGASVYLEEGNRVVFLAGGQTYSLPTLGPQWSGTSEGAPVVFQSFDSAAGSRARIDNDLDTTITMIEATNVRVTNIDVAGAALDAIHVIDSSNVWLSDVHVEGQELTNATELRAALHIDSGSSVVVRGCVFESNTGPVDDNSPNAGVFGMRLAGGDANVQGTASNDHPAGGFIVTEGAQLRVTYSEFNRNIFDGLGFFGSGGGSSGRVSHSRFCGNFGNGFATGANHDGWSVNNCSFSDNGVIGVRAYSNASGRLEVSRSIFTGHEGAGIAADGGEILGEANLFFNNENPASFTRPEPDTNLDDTDPGFLDGDPCEMRLPTDPPNKASDGGLIGAR